jgi:phosphate/sulfate permease
MAPMTQMTADVVSAATTVRAGVAGAPVGCASVRIGDICGICDAVDDAATQQRAIVDAQRYVAWNQRCSC